MEKKELVGGSAPEGLPMPKPSRAPTRLIVCVDGARYDPKTDGNPTNIYRIYKSIQSGPCIDSETSIEYFQAPKYFPAISNADDLLSKDKLQTVLPGQGYQQQIQDVYETCCGLPGERDELVLFGFARGAYVVRAVAGLLHHHGALASAGTADFQKDFKKLKKQSDRSTRRSPPPFERPSSVSTSLSQDFRLPPKIRFLGAFDTVKAVLDDGVFDIGFNTSIQHLRHALALHESRRALVPEEVDLEEFYGTRLRDSGRSEVQAWFIGNHQDVGGASPKGGLALYPFQWMCLEALACGVGIHLDNRHSLRGNATDEPLAIVFPKESNGKETARASFTAGNGLVVIMQDLRAVHRSSYREGSYAVKLASQYSGLGSVRAKKSRSPFDSNGYLRGYCDYGPQGTIIHPSVYLLLDEYLNVALDTKEAKLQRHLEDWRERMLGVKDGVVNFGFWGEDPDADAPDPGAIRVLVCGNTGVGKSTLINKTFGVDVTQISDRSRGIHDVKQQITFEGRPDLIVHDSGGFEAGAETEFLAIEEFLKEKSAAIDVKDRLHVIWFCVEMNSSRTLQTATEKLFGAVGRFANEVPIIVVATKKDDLLDIEFSKRRKELKKLKQSFDEEACEAWAEEQVEHRLEQIREEMESVPGGRLDALVAVSQDDDSSISELSKTTSHCFDIDKVRLLYIRSQVSRIDLKVDMALDEVMRRYRGLVRTATGVSFTVIGPTSHRRAAAIKVCKAILNCFGLPSVSADATIDALKQNVWNHLGLDFTVALAECMNTVGIIAAGVSGGVPVWALSGALSVPLVVPSTCRLFLTMASDMILTLVRSFKEITFRENGHPQVKDVQAAARIYRIRGYSQHVHHDIRKLIPRRNVSACYKYSGIRRTMEDFVGLYKDKLMDGMDLPAESRIVEDGDISSPISETSLMNDLREARQLAAGRQVAALEGERHPEAVELPGDVNGAMHRVELDSTEVVELPVEEKGLERSSVVSGVVELPGSEKDLERSSVIPGVGELPA